MTDKVPRQFYLHKDIAKTLKIAAADDRFGDNLTQSDIVNVLLAKALGVELQGVENKQGKYESLSIDSAMSGKDLENWYSGKDSQEADKSKEIIIDKDTVNLFCTLISGQQHFSRIAASSLTPEQIDPYREAVKKACDDQDITFIE